MVLRYFFKRVFLAFLTFLAIYIIVFILLASFSPDPFSDLLESSSKGVDQAKKLADLRAKYYFDKPAIIRLAYYTADIFQGNFGTIYKTGQDGEIPNLFFGPLRYTILVSLPSFFISALIGIILGTIAAYRRGRLEDAAITGISTFFVAVPSFVLAPFVVLIAIKIGLPFEFKDATTYGFWTSFASLIPPIFVFSITSIAGYVFLVRNQIVSVLSSEYVLIAKAKGLSKSDIFFKYVLKNASIPLVRSLIFSYIILLSGSIVLEQFFRIPGSSSILVTAAFEGEVNISMFSIIFFTSLSLIVDIIGDLSYVFMDPRISFGQDIPTNYWNKIKNWKLRNYPKKGDENVGSKRV
ncbi:ABC transporter permease [Mesomycoplasma flocculare]|uniref:ABC transporter permease n=1 Tax=Mesomycoplasma flocculare TaxID=2128 RepID=A0AAW9XDN2_MESFC|nr:ABC transporter permease [Mesomycoplasma flocculare]MXR39361.1 ABC transporter permease [Mycoplasma sp. MF12]MXR05775.1 ABC transporter permease [Mesomycoplasma flocculare]MXR13409.1 ABC transporter permease [Mesomycoplasma flocculare]MXR22741.1 ABC transporter permease [Mesomycoplasma flocculare]MXR56448.1 ABC transporter permease [Mesomycoplasma flocculare]